VDEANSAWHKLYKKGSGFRDILRAIDIDILSSDLPGIDAYKAALKCAVRDFLGKQASEKERPNFSELGDVLENSFGDSFFESPFHSIPDKVEYNLGLMIALIMNRMNSHGCMPDREFIGNAFKYAIEYRYLAVAQSLHNFSPDRKYFVFFERISANGFGSYGVEILEDKYLKGLALSRWQLFHTLNGCLGPNMQNGNLLACLKLIHFYCSTDPRQRVTKRPGRRGPTREPRVWREPTSSKVADKDLLTLNVRCLQTTLALKVHEEDSLDNVKERIEYELDITAQDQMLLYNGPLTDERRKELPVNKPYNLICIDKEMRIFKQDMASIVNLDDNLIAMVQNLHRACMDSIRVTGMQAESIEVWKRLLVNLFVPALKFVADGHDVEVDLTDSGRRQIIFHMLYTLRALTLQKCSQFCFQLIVANPVLMQHLKPDILWNVLLSLLDNLMTDEAREYIIFLETQQVRIPKNLLLYSLLRFVRHNDLNMAKEVRGMLDDPNRYDNLTYNPAGKPEDELVDPNIHLYIVDVAHLENLVRQEFDEIYM